MIGMNKKGFFFSLKWKISLLIGGIFLLLHSIFSYLVYLDAKGDLSRSRQSIQRRHENIAQVLSQDSFLLLEQLAELFSASTTPQKIALAQVRSTLDKRWRQWQFIGGLENAVLYDAQGGLLKQWGSSLKPDASTVLQTLSNESPNHQILCPDACFQFVLVPVMADAELIGSLGVSRSFADTIIKYQQVTESDLGILVKANQATATGQYKISALTRDQDNRAFIKQALQQYSIAQLIEQKQRIKYQEKTTEIGVFPIKLGQVNSDSPLLIAIDDISDELRLLDAHIQKVWLAGILGLILSLLFLLTVVIVSLRRVTRLSSALPLLAQQRFDHFKQSFVGLPQLLASHDELDILNDAAMTLSEQLESLAHGIKKSMQELAERGLELTAERDFVRQLFDVAPILVLTQDADGRILSINQAGTEGFLLGESRIIGTVFDDFIPKTETEHIAQLKKIRNGRREQHCKIDGILRGNSNQKRHISWIHSLIKPHKNQTENVTLSLGVDISERKYAEMRMLRMATIDTLSGLGNRNNFQTELLRELFAAKRYNTQLALLYLDLDQFKVVNDTSGHEAGDKLLNLVARTLKKAMRATDILSRIGGDEFTIIMPNTDATGTAKVANKINARLAALVFAAGQVSYKISASIGVAIHPQHGKESHELLSNADLAMYHAKKLGGGQYHLFSLENDYQAQLTHKLHWKGVLEDALKNDRLFLLYQPILDVKTEKISHYECLSRIKSATGEILMPGNFIPVAEELGLIGKIDQRVLSKAIEQYLILKQQGNNSKLAVNLSGYSFNDAAVFDGIAHALSVHGVEPEQFIFEITETAAVSNFTAAQTLIEKIKALGCELALDDFGMGFSSFYYLKHLPVDYVKIDGSFIQQLDQNSTDKVLVKALTDVSQALGKKTIAEFVVNKRIMDVLTEFGIDYAQGYYIGKPAQID